MERGTRRWRPQAALGAITAMLLAGGLRLADAAEPAVLEQIPDDAAAVLVVTNVRTFSARLANLGVRMNLQMPPDPVGMALRNLRIVKGFDANNSAAVVLLKPLEAKADAAVEEAGSSPARRAVLLLPTSDSKALLEPWEPGDADKDGISEISLPTGRMERGYVATVGHYVAFAQDHDVLARFLIKKQPLSRTLPADAAQAMERDDIVLYVNVPALAKPALEAIEKSQEEKLGMLDLQNLQSGNETSAALRKEQVSLLFDGTKEFFKDANTGLVTMRLSDAGVDFGVSGQFKQDSTIGRFVAAQKPTRVPSLVGLPDGTYGAAGAAVVEPKSLSQWIGDRMDSSLADPVVAKDPRIGAFKKGVDLTRQATALVEGVQFVFFAAPGDARKSRFNGVMVVDTTDAAKFLALEMELLKNPLSTETMDPDVTSTLAITPDAITVKGVKFTKLVQKYQLRQETAEHPQSALAKRMFEALTAISGGDGSVVYIGSVDKKVLFITGAEPSTIDSAVQAAQKKSDVLATSQGIAASRDQIAANPVLVTYVAVEPWLALVQNSLLQMLGQPPEKAAGVPAGGAGTADLPSVLSVGISGTTVNGQAHLPVSALSSVAKWALNLRSLLGGDDDMPPMPQPAPPAVPEK